MGDLTLNFSKREFVCSHCGRRVGPPADFVAALQRLRTSIGKPLRIVSGYRCPVFNRKVGGIRTSQHLTGNAADIPRGYCTPAQAHAAGLTGVGTRDGFVIHVDHKLGGPFTFKE